MRNEVWIQGVSVVLMVLGSLEAKYSKMRELERRRYAFEQEDANTVPSLDSINVVDSDVQNSLARC